MRHDIDVSRVLDYNRRFHDQVEAVGYDERMGTRHDSAAVDALFDELERVLGRPLPSGGVALDIGAGTGNVAVKLASSGSFERVIAADISERMLERAVESAARHDCSIVPLLTDLDPIPLPDSSVDFVVGCAVLHHVPNVDAVMSEVERVLKPGASFVFIGEPSTIGATLANATKSPALVAMKAARALGRRPPSPWPHDEIDVHTFSLGDIDRLTRRFSDVRVTPEGFAGPLVDQGILAPALALAGRADTLAWGAARIRRALRSADAYLFDRLLPKSMLASIKFCGRNVVAPSPS